MSVDGSVSGSSGKILVLSIRNVEMSSWVSELFSQSKINNVNLRAFFTNTHQEVIGLDISMNETSSVDELDSAKQLISQQKNGFIKTKATETATEAETKATETGKSFTETAKEYEQKAETGLKDLEAKGEAGLKDLEDKAGPTAKDLESKAQNAISGLKGEGEAAGTEAKDTTESAATATKDTAAGKPEETKTGFKKYVAKLKKVFDL
ncbi:hypothetical protein OGAPHI_004222 [Ogataea philodendri]|uniref:Uncharacterized protein n=1 Tax=Ogataea philodendri TaxID=1378263 RepID=A0A9P8T4K2_9ASCO|nr:uncharacterized protein OGAPHI_004222 [Ogataea philodendri]KAH3666033.1 hypothetical protein OGAPHI_004222 [Ogataea philodendri]